MEKEEGQKATRYGTLSNFRLNGDNGSVQASFWEDGDDDEEDEKDKAPLAVTVSAGVLAELLTEAIVEWVATARGRLTSEEEAPLRVFVQQQQSESSRVRDLPRVFLALYRPDEFYEASISLQPGATPADPQQVVAIGDITAYVSDREDADKDEDGSDSDE